MTGSGATVIVIVLVVFLPRLSTTTYSIAGTVPEKSFAGVNVTIPVVVSTVNTPSGTINEVSVQFAAGVPVGHSLTDVGSSGNPGAPGKSLLSGETV